MPRPLVPDDCIVGRFETIARTLSLVYYTMGVVELLLLSLATALTAMDANKSVLLLVETAGVLLGAVIVFVPVQVAARDAHHAFALAGKLRDRTIAPSKELHDVLWHTNTLCLRHPMRDDCVATTAATTARPRL
jgi:hypothetical protein